MYKFFIFFCFFIGFLTCNNNYSITLANAQQGLRTMSCNELMLELIRKSSFNKKFHDKNLALEFYFEREDDRYIGLTFVRRSGVGNGLIYANFQLDLADRTLKIIDPDPPIPIKINKKYVAYIADKCTPDKNLYGNIGRLPDSEFDGSGV